MAKYKSVTLEYDDWRLVAGLLHLVSRTPDLAHDECNEDLSRLAKEIKRQVEAN